MRKGLDRFVEVYAFFSTWIFGIGFIFLLIFGISILPWWYFLIYVLAGIPSLFLLYAFNKIICRVITLENQREKIKTKTKNTDINKIIIEDDAQTDEGIEHTELCKNCGYQLFDDEKFCPNCKKKREETINK